MNKSEIKSRIRLCEQNLESLRRELDAPEIPPVGTIFVHHGVITKSTYLMTRCERDNWDFAGVHLEGAMKGHINHFKQSAMNEVEVLDGFTV